MNPNLAKQDRFNIYLKDSKNNNNVNSLYSHNQSSTHKVSRLELHRLFSLSLSSLDMDFSIEVEPRLHCARTAFEL